VTRKLSVSLCVFRAPLHSVKAVIVLDVAGSYGQNICLLSVATSTFTCSEKTFREGFIKTVIYDFKIINFIKIKVKLIIMTKRTLSNKSRYSF
jgi:hypothetical protein